MRTIAEMLSKGIESLQDLQDSLSMAARLEFATIPPYLCAEWSIKGSDPDNVAGMIKGIVLQEMLHMGLALNMLAAIGGKPAIANKDFIPTYPTDGLPGDVHPGLRVDLLPLNMAALDTFQQIEYPENGPIAFAAAQGFPTIGAFYDAIKAAFQRLQPAIGGNTQVVTGVGGDKLFKISAVSDACNAIEEIKEQGEGTAMSVNEGSFDPTKEAHYYVFKAIALGHQFKEGSDGHFHPDGPVIHMPDVYPFTASADPHASDVFNVSFSDLMRLLEQSWTTNPEKISEAIFVQMLALESLGRDLIQNGIRPEFQWTEKTALI